MHLGVPQSWRAGPVEEAQAVPGRRVPALQKGNSDGQTDLPRQCAERAHKGAVPIHCQGLQIRRIRRNSVAGAPHLGKQRQIRAHFLGPAARRQPLAQISFHRLLWFQLQQRHPQMFHSISRPFLHPDGYWFGQRECSTAASIWQRRALFYMEKIPLDSRRIFLYSILG